ncbi:MAG: aminoacyl-tRNA hydrolase [Actinomycetota bacterium]|nr:aminoacyl-tRNA hydrolase [Actinomycetota bacterium]
MGLGNPGLSYAGNRHNVGFMVADLLAGRMGGRFKAHRGRADVVEGRLAGARVVLVKPKAYMNLSGGPVAALRDFFKVPAEQITVIHDELDLPYGALRLKLGGGDNGHNGLRSLRGALGTGDFHRVRFGIGRPPGRQDPADYVLHDFSTSERKGLPSHVDRAADAVEALLQGDLASAQDVFNA